MDENRITYILKITPSNPHDLFINYLIRGEIIKKNIFNKPINLIGIKGYIKTNE